MKYLVLRDGDIANNGTFDYELQSSWFCDSSLNRRVTYSAELSEGDEIYIAEKGYAIIGVGIVDTIEQFTFKSFDNFIRFGLFESKIKQAQYWYNKFQAYHGKEIKKLHVQEIRVGGVKVFDSPLSMSDINVRQGSWTRLPDDFEVGKQSFANHELFSQIPSSVRFEVYSKYKLTADKHLIDIDHHVPKSLGGPGNIIENLVPIAAGINRYKSNFVPSALFHYGKQFDVDVPSDLISNKLKYVKNKKGQKVAKQIISHINEDVDLAKEVYNKIKVAHFPALK